MSLSKPRSAARRAANRANSRKSTGPKTLAGKRIVSLNALKDGRTAQAATRPLWQTMVELGEDPARYRSLLQDVLNSYPPQSPLELRLCEDITRLMLKLERTQQAQEARLVRTYEKLEGSRGKRLREMEGSASYDALQAEVLEAGLRRAPDSPAKFSETTACLERLQARVESGDFSDEAELHALYGQQPTFRGAGIINACRALAANPADRELAASLRLMILEELRDVAAEGQLYYREHVEISRAMRLECLAPAADCEYVRLQRQETTLDRQLERKIKLLLRLQATTRRTARDADEPSAAVADEPLGWLGVTAQPPTNAAESAEKAADFEIESPPSASTPAARAIALRHKIETPRSSGPSSKEMHQEVVRRIHEIYGLEQPEPEPREADEEGSAAGDSLPK
ncbi:MAG: hypothetical protein ACRD3T_12720 [Terriglobia bacterium]